jgi:hypothetical protein
MQQALEFLMTRRLGAEVVIEALNTALAQPVQENPALIEWKAKGEEIMAQAGIGFHLGAWWADRPWRQR